MKEIIGDIWNYHGRYDYDTQHSYCICLCTNGFVKANGDAVMGRGVAYEATIQIPGVQRMLGFYLKNLGNVAGLMRTSADETEGVFVFPTKHNWWENSDPNLIVKSAQTLKEYADGATNCTFILPRPGCGNGKLSWDYVKPLIDFLPDNVLIISKE